MVVTVGLTVTDNAFGKAPIPWSTVALEPVYDAQRYVDSPWVIEVAPDKK